MTASKRYWTNCMCNFVEKILNFKGAAMVQPSGAFVLINPVLPAPPITFQVLYTQISAEEGTALVVRQIIKLLSTNSYKVSMIVANTVYSKVNVLQSVHDMGNTVHSQVNVSLLLYVVKAQFVKLLPLIISLSSDTNNFATVYAYIYND